MVKKYAIAEERRAARDKEMEELRKQLQGEEGLPQDKQPKAPEPEPEIESAGEPEMEIPSEPAEEEPPAQEQETQSDNGGEEAAAEEQRQPSATEISIEEFKAAQEAKAKAEAELAEARAKAAEIEKKQAEIAAQKDADEKELAELRKAVAEKQAAQARKSAKEKAEANAQAWKEEQLKAISADDYDTENKREAIERKARERADILADAYAEQAETAEEINKRLTAFEQAQRKIAARAQTDEMTRNLYARVEGSKAITEKNPQAWVSFTKEKRYGRSVEDIMAEAYAKKDVDTAAALVQEFVNTQKNLQGGNGAGKTAPKKYSEPSRMGTAAATRSPNQSAKPVTEQEYENAKSAYRAGKLPEKEYSTIKKAFLAEAEKKTGWGGGFKF